MKRGDYIFLLSFFIPFIGISLIDVSNIGCVFAGGIIGLLIVRLELFMGIIHD